MDYSNHHYVYTAKREFGRVNRKLSEVELSHGPAYVQNFFGMIVLMVSFSCFTRVAACMTSVYM